MGNTRGPSCFGEGEEEVSCLACGEGSQPPCQGKNIYLSMKLASCALHHNSLVSLKAYLLVLIHTLPDACVDPKSINGLIHSLLKVLHSRMCNISVSGMDI